MVFFLFVQNLQAQLVNNKGADIIVKTDSFIIKNASLQNDTGRVINEGTIIVEGDFTNNDTVLSLGRVRFEVKGDWENNARFFPDSSTMILNGDLQKITGTQTTTFYDLTLTGTGTKTQTVNSVVLNQLNLNDRELATDTNIMFVTSSDTNAISRTSGFVSSLGDGRLSREMNKKSPYLFPVGSSAGITRYRPVEITPATSFNQTMEVRFANTDATFEGFNRNNKQQTICDINPYFYHQIGRTQGSDPVKIKFQYDPVSDGNWTRVGHWQNVPRWEDLGTTILDTVAGGLYTVTLPGWTDFQTSPFALMLPKVLIDTTQTVIQDVKCNGGSDGFITVADTPITGTPPFHYYWSTNDSNTNTITGLSAGTYFLTVTDSFACPNVYSFLVNEPIAIDVQTTVTNVSCKGGFDGSICLTISGDYPPFTFDWSIGGSDSCITGLAAGAYSLVVGDANGCQSSFTIPVTEPELLVATAEGIDIKCYGANDGFGSLTVTGGTLEYAYLWGNGKTTQDVNALPPGPLDVRVTDANGCTATSGIDIQEPDSLIVTASEDQTIASIYGSAGIEAVQTTGGTEPYSYIWDPEKGLTTTSGPTTTAAPDSTTTYVISVTDDNGCQAFDTVVVHVDFNLYRFPDAFVPGGANNIFKPVMSPTVSVLDLKIFNRWGQLLHDGPEGWDGKYQGKLQPMDTYLFQAEILLPDNTKTVEHGDFVLIW